MIFQKMIRVSWSLLNGSPVGHDPKDDGDHGEGDDRDQINGDDPYPMATEDDASQSIDRIKLGVDHRQPYQPVWHANDRGRRPRSS